MKKSEVKENKKTNWLTIFAYVFFTLPFVLGMLSNLFPYDETDDFDIEYDKTQIEIIGISKEEYGSKYYMINDNGLKAKILYSALHEDSFSKTTLFEKGDVLVVKRKRYFDKGSGKETKREYKRIDGKFNEEK